MATIFSSAALKSHQREVKDAAQKDVVHITENGNGAYVFMSEGLFQQKLSEAAEEAAYTERMRTAIRTGRADIAAGHYVEGIDSFLNAMDSKQQLHG